ncbi:MAG: alpha/beta fold hydrolase [Desulfovibrio sp.]|jgi:dipeptidyl aminopeptidase/acylaminoacyl peptidase|nr:alpha/beta fold hydrolase [Desulfovibrio sp.]
MSYGKKALACFVLILCFLVSASGSWALDMNAVGKDTAKGDKSAPTTMSSFIVNSAGNDLYGIIYIAEGKGPHPTVLVLHGFPGNEKFLDFAQVLRRAGLNSVFFSYRGAWGSNGDFSYTNCIDDAEALVKFLQDPAIVAKYRIDPEKMIVSGHSMGGFVTLNLAKRLKDVKYFISFSGWNIGYYGERQIAGGDEAKEKSLAWIAASAAPLKGTSPQALWEEIVRIRESHNLLKYVPELAGKKIFMVAARKDVPCPLEFDHAPLYAALKKAYPKDVEEFIVDDDHAYSASRIAVIRASLNWLKKQGF